MPKGIPLAPCKRCDGPKDPGPKGRGYCDACRAAVEAERPEMARQRASDWYYANHEYAKERNRRRFDDPDEARKRGERYRAWVAANSEEAQALNRRTLMAYRARLADAFVEDVDALVVLERDDGACGICGDDVDPFSFEVDHIIPLSRGGEHSYLNVQPAHSRCNKTKGARMPEEVLAYA